MALQTQPGTEKVKVRVRTASGDQHFYIAVNSVFVWTRKARQFLNSCSNFMVNRVGGTCTWVENNINTDGEIYIGAATDEADCISMVVEQCPGATIANLHTDGYGSCYCQYGTNMTFVPDSGWINCLLSSISSDGRGDDEDVAER